MFTSARGILLAALLCTLLASLGCDSGNPVAPEAPPPSGGRSSTFVITLSADPPRVEADSSDSSEIQVAVSQAADQMPPPDGTMVTLNTDLGNFGTDRQGNPIPLMTVSLSAGRGSTQFFPGSEVGTANLLAQVGDSVVSSTVEIAEQTLFIEAVQPSAGLPTGGQEVTVQGDGFREPLQVRFGSSLAEVVRVASSRTILVRTPPSPNPLGPGQSLAVDVSVTTSLDRAQPRTASLAAGFSFATDAPPPVFVTEVQPSVGSTSGGERIRILGGGFGQPLRVEIGGRAAPSVRVLSSGSLEVSTPPAAMANMESSVDVAVTVGLDEPEPRTAVLPGAFSYFPDLPPPLFLLEVEPNVGGATGGERVTLRGQGFQDPLRVEFGGKTGVQPEVLGPTEATVGVPSPTQPVDPGGLQAVDVVVTTFLDSGGNQSAQLPGGYTYAGEALEPLFVLSVDPSFGDPAGGETVTLRGEGFAAPLRVEFGGGAGDDATVQSPQQLTVVTPPAPQPVLPGEPLPVTVSVVRFLDSGTEQRADLPGGFTYSAGPLAVPPRVFSVDPSSGPNEGGTEVRIFGSGYDAPVEVRFGSVEATQVTFVSATELRAVSPPATGIGQGNQNMSVAVTVRNRETGLEGTLEGGFTYASPVIITAIDPAQGSFEGDEQITLTGQGFVSPVTVELAGVRQRAETVIDDSEIRFTTAGIAVAQCPDNGELPQMGVTVTNTATGNSGNADLVFTYTLPVPQLTGLAPTFGPQLGNTLVTLNGSGFAAPVRVVFVAGEREFSASLSGTVQPGQVRVSSPRVDDDIFSEVDCNVGGNPDQPGKRYVQRAVDVRLVHLDTGCADTLPNAFLYDPTDTSCRPVPPP